MTKTKAELQKELKELEELVYLKEGLPHIFGQKFYPWARRVWDSTNPETFLCAANQLGKMLPFGTEIPTPSGFKKLENLSIGDQVFGLDGKSCSILAIPFEGRDDGYRIVFADGSEILAGANHLWRCKTSEERFRKRSSRYGCWVERTTRELADYCRYTPFARKPYDCAVIPYSSPVQFKAKNLFDPYALGLILGDGCTLGSIRVTSMDDEILDYMVKHFDGTVRGYKQPERNRSKDVCIRRPANFPQELLNKRSWEKYIPKEYLTSSCDQRSALLQGLMDTDGWVCPDGDVVEFCTVSSQLAKHVHELVFSLGGTSKIKLKEITRHQNGRGRPAFIVRIKSPSINPFRLKRKARLWRGQIRYRHERVIKEIHAIGPIDGRCLTVDGPNNCFLAGRNYVVTHNSTIAIRKNIRLATDPTLWPKYWPNLPAGTKPNLFWYMYPSLPVAQQEFESKWESYHLPRGDFKKHPQYGWEAEFDKGMISKIRFNTGVTIAFKSYSIKVSSLQTATVFHVTADEEMPVEYLPEVKARLNASDGLFLMVFTATLGQDHWRRTMEPVSLSEEVHKDALKLQVSLYDSQFFDDGTPSHWTAQKIQRAINNCPTDAEVKRRVYGRFVKATGLLFEGFSVQKNVVEPSAIPRKWSIWSGVDVGSGGQSGHPAAIVFVAVSEDFRRGRVFRAWRGDGIPTTATDIVEKYRELKEGLVLTNQAYDFAAADFFTVASRLGESFVPARKQRDAGIGLLNTLFKSGMLTIDRDDPELEKLIQELTSLGVNDNKRKTVDDLADSLRYCIMSIPWDFDGIEGLPSLTDILEREGKPKREMTDQDWRREFKVGDGLVDVADISDEFDFWNEMSGL